MMDWSTIGSVLGGGLLNERAAKNRASMDLLNAMSSPMPMAPSLSPALTHNQAASAGVVALLGALLGARNAPQALGSYVGGMGQQAQMRDQNAQRQYQQGLAQREMGIDRANTAYKIASDGLNDAEAAQGRRMMYRDREEARRMAQDAKDAKLKEDARQFDKEAEQKSRDAHSRAFIALLRYKPRSKAEAERAAAAMFGPGAPEVAAAGMIGAEAERAVKDGRDWWKEMEGIKQGNRMAQAEYSQNRQDSRTNAVQNRQDARSTMNQNRQDARTAATRASIERNTKNRKKPEPMTGPVPLRPNLPQGLTQGKPAPQVAPKARAQSAPKVAPNKKGGKRFSFE